MELVKSKKTQFLYFDVGGIGSEMELTEAVNILIFAADIVFDYRQKATRSFEHLQGDYYIAPTFMVTIICLHHCCH